MPDNNIQINTSRAFVADKNGNKSTAAINREAPKDDGKREILTIAAGILLFPLMLTGCSKTSGSRVMRPNDLSEKETEAMLNLLMRAYRDHLDLVMRDNFYTETYLRDPIAMQAYRRNSSASKTVPDKLDKPLVTLSAIVQYGSLKEIDDAMTKITAALNSSSITWNDNGRQIKVKIVEFEFLYENRSVPAGGFISLDKFIVIPRKVSVE